MRNFKLRPDLAIDFDGRKLFRIEAVCDIKEHNVKAGDLGGFVEKEENIGGNAWVRDNAKVYDIALVYGNASICDDALVYDSAHVFGNARVCNNAKVFGNARVCDKAMVYGNASICDYVVVSNDSHVYAQGSMRND